MNNFIFENRTKVYFGRGCVKEYLASLLRDHETIMFAYGCGSIKKNGIYDEVLYILQKEGKTIVEFPGVAPNPSYEKVMEGIELARKHKVELILGVGGGSVIDCCKVVALGSVYEGDWWDGFWKKSGILDFSPLPLGVIVTSGSSGNECNGTAEVVRGQEKIGQDYVKCSPGFALIDPTYTFSEPRSRMLSGGVAALCHVMEIYFSQPDEDNVSDDLAEALMKSIIRNLTRALKEPENYEARSNLLWASVMAKNRLIKAGKRGDFICRQIERKLEAYTGCLHGDDCAVLRPAYYRWLCQNQSEKFARFAVNVWGIPAGGNTRQELAEAGISAFTEFIRGMGLPGTLRDLGVKEKTEIGMIAEGCCASPGSYQRMEQKEINRILEECF